jgi:two-component system chemotaxis sensor kinase CheA
MTFDAEMAEIAKVFFQESREGLDVMEAGLLNLDATADRENINTIFRAAHSIKGGAATFGFGEVAGFTHGVETLLDEMRNGLRPVTSEAVQVLLQSCDCLREMMSATEADKPFDKARIAGLNQEITRILAERPGSGVVRQPQSVSAGDAPRTAEEVAADGVSRVGAPVLAERVEDPIGWRIAFEPVADLLRLRNEPINMFAELERLGAFVAHADLSRLPSIEALDPESCYLAWNIEIGGPIPRQKLIDVFDWVDERCKLEFLPIEARRQAARAAPEAERNGPAPSHSQKSGDAGSIRVSTEKLDNIINLVGELLITQSMLGGFADGIDPDNLDLLREGLLQLARNTRELQESVMRIRMLPISFAFNRFPRLVHDLSRTLGKKVELKLSGEGTELDKTVLEKITDPLVHLVRNALDHGLETPQTRLAAGKVETGTLELGAFHEGGNIIIEVRDDGAGLNKKKILQKARERSLVAADQELTDEQIDNLIFMAGFSTADRVSDVSGRGVGMDVVRRNINDLGGHVQISSEERKGSTIRIRLPLTLAILDGQLVRVGGEIYIFSLLAIVETIQVGRDRLNTVAGRTEVFRLRDEYLPVVKLYELFSIEPDSRGAEDGLLVVVEADGTRVGVLVDDLLAQQQVVIKSIESNFKPVVGIAGATILGDGTVAFIVDVPGLIRSAAEQRASARPVRAA